MGLQTFLHLLAALQFGFGCYYDYTYVNFPATFKNVTKFGGKFKYLTYLNACLLTLYFIVALLNDLFGNNEATTSQKPLIRRIKDTLFSSLTFPLSMFVGLTFWGIYAIDRELILPTSLDPYFPTWLNHVMHTNIMIGVILEMVTAFRMYPRKNIGLSILSSFMILYLIWIHYIYFHTGAWVYPILDILNWPVRIIFYLCCLGLVGGMYTLGEKLNLSLWAKEIEKNVKSGKKKAK